MLRAGFEAGVEGRAEGGQGPPLTPRVIVNAGCVVTVCPPQDSKLAVVVAPAARRGDQRRPGAFAEVQVEGQEWGIGYRPSNVVTSCPVSGSGSTLPGASRSRRGRGSSRRGRSPAGCRRGSRRAWPGRGRLRRALHQRAGRGDAADLRGLRTALVGGSCRSARRRSGPGVQTSTPSAIEGFDGDPGGQRDDDLARLGFGEHAGAEQAIVGQVQLEIQPARALGLLRRRRGRDLGREGHRFAADQRRRVAAAVAEGRRLIVEDPGVSTESTATLTRGGCSQLAGRVR